MTTVGNITLDGNFTDWAPASLVQVPANTVAGYDVYGQLVHDSALGNNYIIGISANATDPVIGAHTFLYINTDQNAATGFSPFSTVGAEYVVIFQTTSGSLQPYLYAATSAGIVPTPLNGGQPLNWAPSTDGESLEIAIPQALLTPSGGAAPSSIDFAALINNSVGLPTVFGAAPEYIIPDLISTTTPVIIDAVKTVHINDIAYSGNVTGPYNFIDLPNLEASYSDLIQAFGTNTPAMQNWYNVQQPIEHRADTFDGLDYIASYSDLITAFKSAGSEQAVLDAGAMHFITNGSAEGRTTTFNSLDYIASYGDLIKAFGTNGDAGAYHFIENGSSEGRTTSFDGLDYIASYSDLIKAFGANEQSGAAHFIANGSAEGRTTTFDGLDYIAGYTDLMTAFGANNDAGASHYITNGLTEGRQAQAFDVGAYQTAHPDLIGQYASNDAFLTAYINTYATTGKFLI
jgi:hypothetical protein